MADALNHMHSCDLVHLDVKSTNILVADAGMTIKLIDFGEASNKPEEGWTAIYADRPKGPFGTPGHIAPEMIRTYRWRQNEYYGPPTDIWSMACVVYEMITGVQPERWFAERFPADNNQARMWMCGKHARDCPHELAMPYGLLPESVCSAEAKEVLKMCFDTNQEQRVTAAGLLSMSFLRPTERRGRKRGAAID
uniref:Protein kinase domain-containing protein n=1 Tax=Hemiselmis andersenii TaxID=464988 RepID=A0A7S1HAE3_HEMAN|mmetsp:Transcript_49649/g.120440  ORF Transcript_49649/g.120440 Transcript_49649/m.120440 type:complete len:194 (+) Transcript_49649:1-582(+)